LESSKRKIVSKGLGDTVEKVTKLTGIKKVANVIQEVTGKPCGCNKRKEALNKMFPYTNLRKIWGESAKKNKERSLKKLK